MRRASTIFLWRGLFLLTVIWASRSSESADRIFVGVATCSECHFAQYNQWRLSKHSRAYAALAMPESKEIARLSGVAVDPYKSPICLGCHATAADTDSWERDDQFYLEDGVQCEKCHGRGGEYMKPDIMKNKEAAMKAGLQMPKEDICMICHNDKGSHIAVLKVKKFNYTAFAREIAHPGKSQEAPKSIAGPTPTTGPQYVGAIVCAKCHQGPGTGDQYGQWRLSPHANAFAVLSTEKGRKLAADSGIHGDPQSATHCLSCHQMGTGESANRFAATFNPYQGVECESCHGPGSEYIVEAIMRDPVAAHKAGLKEVNREICFRCHIPNSNGKKFDTEAGWKKIQHAKPTKTQTSFIEYKTPSNLALTRDGKRLYIACEGSDSVMTVNAETGQVISELKLQHQPHGVCLSPDEISFYVSNRGADTVSVVDTRTFTLTATIPVGDEPHGLVTNVQGDTLYVVNAASYDVSVIDLKTRREVKRLSAARGPWSAVLSPDGKFLYITNNLSHFVPFRTPSLSEVTVIETERSVVSNRFMIPEANLVQGLAFSPDGEFALVTLTRTKNNVPMTRVIQGWVLTNGIGVLWKDGRVDQLLLDEADDFFADPTAIAITPDGRFAYATGGGIDAVAAIDLNRMKALLSRADEKERKEVFPNRLSLCLEFVVKRIPVGRSPRGMAVSPDSRYVYVADGLDDAISVIDTQKQERVRVMDLSGPKEITLERKGERIFHSADSTYGRQFSCYTCHPDGSIDGITYDTEPDGVGVDPVDNRTLRGILDTAPFKWTGLNPSLSRQCGPRLAVFFTRIDPFTPEQVAAVERYICTIPLPPNRYRQNEGLTPAQRRGKTIFERTRTNSGQTIPLENRCDTCHPAPYYTSRKIVDVGTQSWLDHVKKFDIPQLNNIYETAPYLHDGRANTLEEIWTRYNPQDKHGITNDMTKDQLNDLIEYLKTL